jgi:hypothetical protein
MAPPTSVVDHTGTAKCPELLCLSPALLVSGWHPAPPRRALPPSSSLIRAHASNQLPPPNSCIHTSSGGPCRLLRAPAGNRFFPTLSPQFFPQMPGPQPRRSHRVHLPVSSPASSAFPRPLSSRLTVLSANTIFRGEVSRLSSDISCVQASEFACLPDRSHRCKFAGRPRLVLPGRTCFVTSARTGYAIRLIQAIDGERTFTFPDLRPCRLLQGPTLIDCTARPRITQVMCPPYPCTSAAHCI